VIVGAYPSAPERSRVDAADFDSFHERIALVTGCSGFEIPFGSAYVPDEESMLRLLGRGGTHVLTLLPAVLERGIGLASPEQECRAAAVALTRRAIAAAAVVNDQEGRPVIDSVLLQSAPRTSGTSADAARAAFARSLDEVAREALGGVRIIVEHCDSFEGPEPAKGFLDLGTELALAARNGFGTAINWGRSYLETRRIDGPLEHVRRARDAGTLAVLGVSGVSSAATALGPAFSDSHAPVRTERASRSGFAAGVLDTGVLAGFLRSGPSVPVIAKIAGGEDLLADSVEAARAVLEPVRGVVVSGGRRDGASLPTPSRPRPVHHSLEAKP